MFALIKNGSVSQYPYSLMQLKKDSPNTSFPESMSDTAMAEFGVLRVFFATQPEVLSTQILKEATPIFDTTAQRWTQVWQVTDMTPEQLAEFNSSQSNSIRENRNRLLSESDWTQITDAPVDKAAWATYRQQLRDVTAQAELPWNVLWPAVPR